MPPLFHRYATPLMTGLFLISLITGIALFFHTGPAAFRGAHEWLSMLLILPFFLHLWRNLRPMLGYLRRAPMALSLALSVLLTGFFFLPAGGAGERGGPPQFQLAHRVMTATPEKAADVFGLTPEDFVTRLQAAGFAAASADQPLTAIATGAGKSEAELAAALNAFGS